MSDKNNKPSKTISIEDILAKEIEETEANDPNAYYDAKLVSVKVGREMGFSDAELEESLGIKLRPKDRSGAQK